VGLFRALRSRWRDPFPSADPATWTIAVLPDTQVYSRLYPELFEAQTRWIAEHADRHRIRLTLHEGDVTDHNLPQQWVVAGRAFRHLDGRVPYLVALGNHDYGERGSGHDRSTLLHDVVRPDALRAWPSFGGAFEEGRVDNAFLRVDTPSGPWLALALELGPRDAVVEWAANVLAAHPRVPAVVVTHAYLYDDGTRYHHARVDQKWSPHVFGVARQPGGLHDGEALYQRLIARHPSVQLVVCGHVLGTGTARLTSPQDGGSVVHQLLANYQHRARGGDGYLRLMEIDAARQRIRVRTYSPVLDRFATDAANAFELALPRF
jgi:hypothetical protein